MRACVVGSVLLAACGSSVAVERRGAAPEAASSRRAEALARVSFEGGLHGGTPNADPTSTACAGGPADATPFGLYVLALTWAPDFCCKSPGREECQSLAGSYGASHLTLHGLWPTYDDREGAAHGYAWPELCGDCWRCARPSPECAPDPSTLPEDMATYGPGYMTDGNALAAHEWARHGSCTGLSPSGYFAAALTAMLRLPGAGTPGVVSERAGRSVRLSDLEAALGPARTVLLGCDAGCNLTQVAFCLGRDASGAPAGQTACPESALAAGGDDDGCVVQGCERVHLRRAGGSCSG